MATNTVFVTPSFGDLKQKSSGGGGFSDGGVINENIILKEAGGAPVVGEIAPPKGVVYSGVALGSVEATEEPGSVSVTNFGPTNNIEVQEYFVQEDGTEVFVNNFVVNAQNIEGVSEYFESGGRLQYPNKLRYKLNPAKGPFPAGRVTLKFTLKQFDRPSDQTV